MMTFCEYGRPVKFYWNPEDLIANGDEARITIGHQDTRFKTMETSLRHIKEAIAYIESKNDNEKEKVK